MIYSLQYLKGRLLVFSKIKNWFHNYWYYYKWPVIIISAFAIIIGICIFQSASKEDYDVSIIYTGPHMFSVKEKESLSNTFEQLMDVDYNGDGKKVADIIDLPAFTDEQIEDALYGVTDDNAIIKYAPYTVDVVRNNFSQLAASSDASICLLDQYWYELLKDANRLCKLEDILGYRPEGLIDDYSIYLSDLDAYKYFDSSLGMLPDDTIVCFKLMSSASAFIGKKDAEKMYDYSKKMLISLFDFEMPS